MVEWSFGNNKVFLIYKYCPTPKWNDFQRKHNIQHLGVKQYQSSREVREVEGALSP